MLDFITKVNGAVNNFVWGVPAMILIIGVGLYLTLRTRCIQIRRFGTSMRETIGDFPIVVGSGVKPNNVLEYLEYADGAIVGRGFKDGERVDLNLVKEFMAIVKSKYN